MFIEWACTINQIFNILKFYKQYIFGISVCISSYGIGCYCSNFYGNPEVNFVKDDKLIEVEWGICASVKCTIIGYDIDLSPVRRQVIICANTGLLPNVLLKTYFPDIYRDNNFIPFCHVNFISSLT